MLNSFVQFLNLFKEQTGTIYVYNFICIICIFMYKCFIKYNMLRYSLYTVTPIKCHR